MERAYGPPHKVLRHFPITQRIKRLFPWKELAKLQGCCDLHRSELGSIQFLVDSNAMKHIEDT